MEIFSFFYKAKKGGFNKRLYELLEAFSEQGHGVHLLACEVLPVRGRKIRQYILRAPFKNQENLIFWSFVIANSLIKIPRLTRRLNIDMIITFAPFYTFLCSPAVILTRIPAVTFLRADNMKHGSGALRNMFFWIIDWIGAVISTKILVVSQHIADVYRKRYHLSPEKIVVIPNNVEKKFEVSQTERKKIRESLGVEEQDFLISTCGVFNRGKNFELLIRAAKMINSPKVKLVIIGDEVVRNGERSRLESMVAEFALQDRVTFTGWKDNPLPFIASSDLFVFPSKWEGAPNALLEALSCGIPCLGSDIPPIKEILHYEDLLFRLPDPSVLARKINEVKSNPMLYQALKAMCRNRLDYFLFDWKQRVIDTVLQESKS